MSPSTNSPGPSKDPSKNPPRNRLLTTQDKIVYVAVLGGLIIVNAILVETGWSWVTATVLQATAALIVILAWLAYLRCRQQRSPLSDKGNGQGQVQAADSPPKRIWFTKAELVFWAYTVPTYGLMFAFAWLDWSRSATLAAWWVIVGIHALVTLAIWMVRRARTLRADYENHG